MLLSLGANSHGQLGLAVVNEQVEEPTEVDLAELWIINVKQIACGGAHSVLLDSEGKLHSCGWNVKLQLGCEKCKEISTFQRIWSLSGITFTNIACGWDFSCGVTDDHFLFVWGSNSYGQLGLPKEHFPGTVKPIRLQVNACLVSMGLRHTAIVNSKGEVWITGYGRHGQLGLGKETMSMDRFKHVAKIGKITHIACGQNHTVAWCSEEKALYVWGDNKHGQLLLDTNKYTKVFNPQKIDIGVKKEIKKLLSGWSNNLLWLEDGTLISWGQNNCGQLGTDSKGQRKFNIKLPGCRQIKDVALGSEHTICLADDNTIWAWGWNEHCNTGIKTEIEKCIFSPTLVTVDISETITQIYAGGAHNFIVTEKPGRQQTHAKDNQKL